jgi:hypothetical protein
MYIYWSVVSTPLKNISQMGRIIPNRWKNKNDPNHHPVYIFYIYDVCVHMLFVFYYKY